MSKAIKCFDQWKKFMWLSASRVCLLWIFNFNWCWGGGGNALIYLRNYYPKCKEVVFPFLTVGFQHLLVVVKRLQQTHHLRIHLSSASLRECVCSPYSCWAGISICIWTDVWAWEETGETLLAPGLKSLLELLIWCPEPIGTQTQKPNPLPHTGSWGYFISTN